MLAGLIFLLGLVVGSFLNVVIWRVPRGESIVRPGSHCPACAQQLSAAENVPVLSWLVLRGRCRHCGARVSARYPIVEALTGLLFLLGYLRLGWHPVLLAYGYLAASGVALAYIDMDHRRLPDVLTLPAYPVELLLLGIAAAAGGGAWPYERALIGMAALFAGYFAMVLAYPGGMGLGDVKLAGVLGLFLGYLGWGALAVGAFAAFLLGGLVGIGLLVAGAGRKAKIPFGPYMLAGALVGTLAGGPIAQGYLHLLR